MLVLLKGDSVKGNNQIYVKYNGIVSAANFDFKYREPFEGNQEIIIPELFAGTYYLLTTGKTSSGNSQNISLLARIMPFEIRKVSPNVGSNYGEVTTLIEGSKLDESTRFTLLKNGISYARFKTVDTLGLRYQYSNESANQSIMIDPTSYYTTFDLTGLDTGNYDLLAIKNGTEHATLIKGFKVINGIPGELNVDFINPASTRSNANLTIEVLFNNSGNTDLVNKKIVVSSSTGAPLALNPNDLSKNKSSVEIIVQEEGGPPNRLRPGGNGSVLIYTKSSAALGFIILE
jgi:hypothetical protein